MAGLPREAAGAEHLRPGIGQRQQAVAVHEEVVRAPHQREAAAREAHELERQREAVFERHRDDPQGAVGVGEVDGGERHAHVGK